MKQELKLISENWNKKTIEEKKAIMKSIKYTFSEAEIEESIQMDLDEIYYNASFGHDITYSLIDMFNEGLWN